MLITFELHNPGVYINTRFQKKLLRKIFLTILSLNLSKAKTSLVLFNLKVYVKNIVPLCYLKTAESTSTKHCGKRYMNTVDKTTQKYIQAK